MSRYSEALEFFVENGIQLTSEQLEALKENTKEEGPNLPPILKAKYMDALKNGKIDEKQIAEWKKAAKELNEKIRTAERIKLDDLE